jgi:CO/xanthine dehydrogenase Mo-binding subunit
MGNLGFTEDIYPHPLLYALTIRSPVVNGRLTSIEVPKLPNTYILVTADDIPGENHLEDTDLPILAKDRLSYFGEPVALLLGPDQARLESYAEQCRVIAEEGEAVFGSHRISGGMILAERKIQIGDPGAAFAAAKTIVGGDYHTGIQEHWYSESVGALACFEHIGRKAEKKTHAAPPELPGSDKPGGKTRRPLIVYTATQWPFHVKRSVARTLNLSPAEVLVEPTMVGLHMDGKLWYPSLVSCHAALGAFIAKKPVRLVLTREEDFRFSPKRAGTEINISSALGEKGEVLGTEINIAVNLGAYGVNAEEILDQTCLGSLGLYESGSLKVSGLAVRTNIPPQGPFSGFGLAQGFFAIERHVSYLADLKCQDPAEWRKNNYRMNNTLPIGLSLREAFPIRQLMDTVVSMSDYYRKWASYELLRQSRQKGSWNKKNETLRGIGISIGYQGSGFLYPGYDKGNYAIEITLEKDGSLEIRTSMINIDDDYIHIWARIAAEILSIDAEAVRIKTSPAAGKEEDSVPDSGPASASRNITAVTKLIEKACVAIRKQRFRDPLPITVRRRAMPLKSPQWDERFPPPPGKISNNGCFSCPGWAAGVVEVEIDPIEYMPKIRGIWLGVDGGRILSEARARRSLKASTVQALGWASHENLSYADGIISRAQFEEYDIFSPDSIPPIQIDFIWNDSGDPKGIGELPFNCVPAAYLQAVSQAMDHHFQNIPLRPVDIRNAEKLKFEESPV